MYSFSQLERKESILKGVGKYSYMTRLHRRDTSLGPVLRLKPTSATRKKQPKLHRYNSLDLHKLVHLTSGLNLIVTDLPKF